MKAGYFGTAVVFLCLALLAVCSPAEAQSAANRTAAKMQGRDILLQGKVRCSLEREVVMPFKGTITALTVQPGQTVKAGDVLARYTLAPEIVLQLRKQAAASQIMDMETSLANADNTLLLLERKRSELVSLAKENMAPALSLTQVEREIQYSKQSVDAARKRLQVERDSLKDFEAYLKHELGGSLKPVFNPSQPACIRSPIAGSVIAIQSDLRASMQIGLGAPTFLIGVMDPMVMQAQIFESDLPKVALGDKAEVTLESIPNRTFEARVSRLSLTPLVLGLQQPSYYDIELTIPNPDHVIKEGFKGRVLFHLTPGAK